MALDFIKLVKGDSIIAQVGNYGFFKLAVETSGGGGGGSGDVSFSRIFSENSPATISAVSAEISANNMTSSQVAETYGWNLGDTTDITLSTGEVIQMQIIGFNHDDKSDGSGKAGITLQMVNCLATPYSMNNTETNMGGYATSVMKTSTLPMIKSLLPQEWVNIIKFVDKKSANGGGANYSAMRTLSEDLFLLSEIELTGSRQYSIDGEKEGVIYEYWKGKNRNDRIKNYDTDADGIVDTTTVWWIRSSAEYETDRFCCITKIGEASNYPASRTRGVSFAFCV